MKPQYVLGWLVAAVPLILASCGKTDVPGRPALTRVTGQVLFDGMPVGGAVVTFHNVSGGPSSFGQTDAAGYYRLQTFEPDDGATRGQHHVTVTKYSSSTPEPVAVSQDDPAYEPPPPMTDLPAPPHNELPAVYSLPQTTQLTASVPELDNADIVLQLASDAQPKKTSRPIRRT